MMKAYKKITALPGTIPLFPLAGALLLPRSELPLNIFEPRYLQMIDAAMYGERIIGIIQPEEGATGEKPRLEQVGCAGRITSYTETNDGRVLVTLQGVCRFRLKREIKARTAWRKVEVNYKPFAGDLVVGAGALSVDRNQLMEAFRQFLEENNMTTNWEEVNEVNTEVLVNTLSLMSPYGPRDKQALLEAPDLKSRAEMLVAITELAMRRQIRGQTTRMQ